MGIFSKKECSICGDKSGLLTNRKLADGNLCKECRARLSPFYDVTNRDTVALVAAQLEYRERNLSELDRFRPSVAVGGAYKIFIDTAWGKFAVALERELREGNPDLFDLGGLRGCSFTARERIIKGDEDESDHFDYDFYLRFSVDHPFVRSFSCAYSGVTVASKNRIKEEEIGKIYRGQKEIKTGFAAFFSGVDRRATEEYLRQYALAQDMIDALSGAAASFRSSQMFSRPVYSQPAAPAFSPAAPAPGRVNFCANCGAKVDGGAFCPHCGTRL